VPSLLILGAMGYMSLDRVAASFLFQLVFRRYIKGSITVTSNKSYGEWGQVFGDEFAAAAAIDPPAPGLCDPTVARCASKSAP
jgi:DNA replication protein DnaC